MSPAKTFQLKYIYPQFKDRDIEELKSKLQEATAQESVVQQAKRPRLSAVRSSKSATGSKTDVEQITLAMAKFTPSSRHAAVARTCRHAIFEVCNI